MGVEINFKSNASKILKEVPDKAKRALTIIGMKAESYAKMLSPVDTGLLRNSITFALAGERPQISSYSSNEGAGFGNYDGTAPKESPDEYAVYIGTNVHYAPFQELGHHTVTGKWIEPRPFLRPAVENHTDEYQAVIKSELKA